MYNPAEGNHSYTDAMLELEMRKLEANPNGMTPQEKHDVQVLFCKLLAEGQTTTRAMQIINGTNGYTGGDHVRVSRKTLYAWRKFDEVFRDAWDEAYHLGTDKIEDKAMEIALEGNASLLIFAMKTRNPQRYAITRSEISGPGGAPLPTQIELIGVDPDEAGAEPDDQGSGSATSET